MGNNNDTTFRVVELREANPTMPYSEIARLIGVTRQRVQQIATELGMSSKGPCYKRCVMCDRVYLRKEGRGRYCSYYCLMHAYHVLLRCEVCKQLFWRNRSAFNAMIKRKYGHVYCSRQCMGRQFGSKNKGRCC